MAEVDTTKETTNRNGVIIKIETRPREEQNVIFTDNVILAFLPILLELKLEEDGTIIILDQKGNYTGQIATRYIRKNWAE